MYWFIQSLVFSTFPTPKNIFVIPSMVAFEVRAISVAALIGLFR